MSAAIRAGRRFVLAALLAAFAVSPAAAVCAPRALAQTPPPLPRVAEAIERGALTILIIGSSSTTGYGVGGATAAYPMRTAEILEQRISRSGARLELSLVASGALRRLPSARATLCR